MSLFSKFAFSFGLGKKNRALPAPTDGISCLDSNELGYTVSPYQTLASFDLKIDAPKYQGAVPEATIKFYPFN